MSNSNNRLWRLCCGLSAAFIITLGLSAGAQADDNNVSISSASWNSEYGRLRVKGEGDRSEDVTVVNEATGEVMGTDDVNRERRWRVTRYGLEDHQVPCRVRAEQTDGSTDERKVDDAPDNCDDGSGGGGPGDPGAGFPNQTDFKILMNYELGMHCTGFEFAYCCVLPVYNSILTQVVKPEGDSPFPALLEGDPAVATRDGLGRETVLRDHELYPQNHALAGQFKKYVLRYWHEAQPRHNADDNYRGAPQGTNRLISAAEGNSLLSWNTLAYPALIAGAGDPDGFAEGAMKTGEYEGAHGVVRPDKVNPSNYQNVVWNHLYIYSDLEGSGGNTGNCNGAPDGCKENKKIRLGLNLVYPENCGPAFHPLGPANPDVGAAENTCGGNSNGNVLTYSGDNGTIVYTQMKVLEDLPIYLTSPRIWEALGLPLTPFEDTIDFFNNPSAVTEESVRPFVAMKAQLFDAHTDEAVMDRHGDPVIGFGTAPIDIPNCERCHSNAPGTPNSPNSFGEQWSMVQQEANYWGGAMGATDWYPRLKSAAVSMLYAHDVEHGTGFMDCYPYPSAVSGCDDDLPDNGFDQATRLGKESVICQKCHADNVIAVVKSAYKDAALTQLIPPISGAIHHNHRSGTELELTGDVCSFDTDCDSGEVCGTATNNYGFCVSESTEVACVSDTDCASGEVCGTTANNLGICGVPGPIAFSDNLGRDGGCQGCHPAHRSDGDLSDYPITLEGTNFHAGDDNRLADGGCFVGRDVHSNPMKDLDVGDTDSHLNAVGTWLVNNVTEDQGDWRGIWCTNCHTQLSQEIWKAENCSNILQGDCDTNPRAEPTLAAVAAAVGTTPEQAASWLDPKSSDPNGDFTHAIWTPDPGLCDYVSGYFGITPANPAQDGAVAVVEVLIGGSLGGGGSCSNGGDGNAHIVPVDCGFVTFDICGSTDGDGDFNVNLTAGGDNSPFCTTPDCVTAAQGTLGSACTPAAGERCAAPVPFSAATDGRDHWLAAGEPHCADCHAWPYVEPSGGIPDVSDFKPFNNPRKSSLMRYSRGHQDITCQGCHESIHGLYPVTPDIDTTTYAQAASLNHDGSHGPLKCGTCHEVNNDGVPRRIEDLKFQGQEIRNNYDLAVGWAHTFTLDHDSTQDYCVNCHEDESHEVSWREEEWLEHSMKGRVPRKIMDRVEIQEQGFISGETNPLNTVCRGCHDDESDEISCTGSDGREWKEHLIEGRVAEKVWVQVSLNSNGTDNTTCGW